MMLKSLSCILLFFRFLFENLQITFTIDLGSLGFMRSFDSNLPYFKEVTSQIALLLQLIVILKLLQLLYFISNTNGNRSDCFVFAVC